MVNAKALLSSLEGEPEEELFKKTRPLLLSSLQGVINLYVKYAVGRSSGTAEFAKRALIARSINDLIAGYHLLERGFIPQAYSAIRPILESLDLILLFERDPAKADIWAEGGDEAFNKLRPSAVRKLLGKESHDVLYSHFCDRSHPSFRSIQTMSAMRRGQADIDVAKRKLTVSISVWLGGTKFDNEIVSGLGFCFLLVMAILVRETAVLKGIKEEEFSQVALETLDNFKQFIDQAMAPSLKLRGLSDDDVENATSPLIIEMERLSSLILNDPAQHQ